MTVAVPTDSAGLEDILSSPDKMAELFDNHDGKLRPNTAFGDFLRRYATNVAAKSPEIAEEIRTQAQTAVLEFLRKQENTGAVPRQRLSPEALTTPLSGKVASRYAAYYNPDAPGAALDAKFGNNTGMRDFMRATWHKNIAKGLYGPERDEIVRVQNSFGSNVPADGGFLIPESLRSDLLRVALETAVVRSRARVIPMESLTVPYPTIDDTSHASSVYGGLIGYWTEESAAITSSSTRFGKVLLHARKLAAYSEVPNELFMDAIVSFMAFINEAFPEGIAWFEDTAFLTGSGVGQPLGALNANAKVTVAVENGQSSGTIAWENIVKMYARMLPSSQGRAVWVAHLNAFPELATMALSVGTGGSAIWLNNGVAGPPMTILGRPVIFTEKVPALGAAGCVNYLDFGYYLIGDRQTIQADSSPHFKFSSDVTAVRFIERVDGQPWLQSAITPQNGSDTLSPFVQFGD